MSLQSVTLRTRAEVDADIAAIVRNCTRASDGLLVDGELLRHARCLCRLVRETTRPEAIDPAEASRRETGDW